MGSITDELREWASSNLSYKTRFDELVAIADHIDAEHKKAVRELNDYASDSVLLPRDADGVPIHIGDVMDGVDKYDSLKEAVTGEVVTIHFDSIGDSKVETTVGLRVWAEDGRSYHVSYIDPHASVYRHHRAPTVEDVLYDSLRHFGAVEERTPEVEEWLHEQAAKLRLAGDAE